MARATPEVGGRASPRRLLEREGAFSWIMLAPGVLFLIAFVAYPFFYGIYLSLQERQVAKAGLFVGLGNFVTGDFGQVYTGSGENVDSVPVSTMILPENGPAPPAAAFLPGAR